MSGSEFESGARKFSTQISVARSNDFLQDNRTFGTAR